MSDKVLSFAKSLSWLVLVFFITTYISGCLEQTQESDPVPVLLDYPIAYVKRPIPVNNQGEPANIDLLDLENFNPGADLFLRDRASPSAAEKNITFQFTGGQGDVKDIESSADGSKLIFAMRAPEIENANDDEQPTWNIWQYEIATNSLERVIKSDITAEAGQDISPHYLPDGRIIFSSTRQRDAGAILLDEGKPQFTAETESRNGPAFVLHVMDADGDNIKQISFNHSHDFDPTVSSNGDIIFSRWDNMGRSNSINLYKINDDGSGLEIVYGAHSHDTGSDDTTIQFSQAREMTDGRFSVRLMPFRGTNGSGLYTAIDLDEYLDNEFVKSSNTPVTDGNAQQTLLNLDIFSDNRIATDGYVNSFYPLWDNTNRALISWSPCRLIQVDINGEETIVPCTAERLAAEDAVAAPPLYGIYIYDLNDNTQLPIVTPEESIIIHDVVATYERLSYAVPNTNQLNSNFETEGVGVLNIRSVYDTDGLDTTGVGIDVLADPAQTLAADRPARFLRIVKGVPLPNRDTLEIPGTAFGRSRNQLMREIIGYAPVEPDGSVMVKVPANVPLAISVLDENGRRISARHQNWLQVIAGETKTCNGCHDHRSDIPHGNNEGPVTVYSGASQTGIRFPNTDNSIRPQVGETMAETMARISCISDCAYLTPSVDINFEDYWTHTDVRAADTSFSYLYADLTTAIPTNGDCVTNWMPLCRIIINYETHIQPIWEATRSILNTTTMMNEDRTCTTCHNSQDNVGNAMVPAGQLDLTGGASSDEPDHLIAYRELFFNDNEQEVVDNALQDIQIQATDNDGNPRFEQDEDGNLILGLDGNPIPVLVTVRAPGPSMSVNGANSSYFLEKFDAGGSHENWLTNAEKRLISEWLDIGAQYYNNPFDIPPP